jgi:hypothetical protein
LITHPDVVVLFELLDMFLGSSQVLNESFDRCAPTGDGAGGGKNAFQNVHTLQERIIGGQLVGEID